MLRQEDALRGALRLARQLWWLGALVLAAAGSVGIFADIRAQPSPTPPGPAAMSSTYDDAQVLAANAALGAAMRAGDRSAARRLLSLEFSYVDDAGALHPRKQVLSGLKGMASTAPIRASERSYGGIAMVTGHRVSAHGNTVFFLDIWARQKHAWRALVMQDVVVAAANERPQPREIAAAAGTPRSRPKVFDCKNPCETIPYRVRSAAEQDVLAAFQAMAKAAMAHDADGYGRHLAGEFVHYQTGQAPMPRPERIALVADQKQDDVAALFPAIGSMRLWVYGDAAAMISAHDAADGSAPPSRFVRVWVHRNGQWQLAISVQTYVALQRTSSQ